jgi:hypothetical protein
MVAICPPRRALPKPAHLHIDAIPHRTYLPRRTFTADPILPRILIGEIS